MKKIKLTRANKSIMLKALAPYYYQQRALGHSTQEVGKLILKIDSLPSDKKATFSTEKIFLIYYRRRTPLNAAAARKVDYPRSTPSRIGAVCRSQQGGKELADLVAVFADRAG